MEGFGAYADRRYYPIPDLIVVDFRLGGETGLDFIRWLQIHPTFSHIPFAILSGSMRPSDKDIARQLGITRFFEKKDEFSDMRNELQRLLQSMPDLPPPQIMP